MLPILGAVSSLEQWQNQFPAALLKSYSRNLYSWLKKVNNQSRCPAMPGPVTYMQCREEMPSLNTLSADALTHIEAAV